MHLSLHHLLCLSLPLAACGGESPAATNPSTAATETGTGTDATVTVTATDTTPGTSTEDPPTSTSSDGSNSNSSPDTCQTAPCTSSVTETTDDTADTSATVPSTSTDTGDTSVGSTDTTDPSGSTGSSTGGTTMDIGETGSSSGESSTGDPPDDDMDGFPNDGDNCPDIANPDQNDQDGDGQGDVCDIDLDGDGIPDDDDVFPNDGTKPGTVTPKKIYAHSSSNLYTVDVFDYTVAPVAGFQYDSHAGQMTDVAIDRSGQLFGVTFFDAFVCSPQTAFCYWLGGLPNSYNGLTWIPAGTLLPDKDALIGISNNGNWTHLQIQNQMVVAQVLGNYGMNLTSAGDSFSIEGVGTFAAVNKPGAPGNAIITVNPVNGAWTGELAILNGSTTIYGLAGWEGLILAFNSSGDMIKIDPVTKVVTPLGNKGIVWWGAGVGTILPQ